MRFYRRYDNQVLVFRDQELTPQQLVDFTAQLGNRRPRMPSQTVRDISLTCRPRS